MIVASGVIPYQYESVYPYKLGVDNPIMQMSGILIEQAMTVFTAEIFRFLGSQFDPVTFNKYVNKNTSPVIFTPLPDGSNLDGRIDGILGGAYFSTYISDLRNQFFVMGLYQLDDLGGNFSHFFTDWLLWVGSTSGTNGDFTRQENAPFGDVLSCDINELGGSGVLYDIDLREVSWQPYSRTRPITLAGYHQAEVCMTPYFPNFQKTDGSFVFLNSRDSQISLSTSEITRQLSLVNTGLLILDGDMFFNSTDFCIAPGSVTRDNLEGQVVHNFFTLNSLPGRSFIINLNHDIDPRASARLTTQALAYGGYTVGAINNPSGLPGLVVPSGTLSFTPIISYGGDAAGSGYYAFDNSFWIMDTTELHPSGMILMNPHNGDCLWFKLADQTSFTDQAGFTHAFSNTVGLFDTGSTVVRAVVTGDSTTLGNDIRLAFLQFDKLSLDLASVVNNIEDYSIFGPNDSAPATAVDACTDGSEILVLAHSVGIARNIYIFDSSFNFVDQKLFLGSFPQWLQNGIFTGGTYGNLTGTDLTELIIDPSPANPIVTAGTQYTIDTSNAGWPAADVGTTILNIMDAVQVTGDPHIPDGTWIIAETASGVVLFRGTLSGTSIIPDHAYVLPLSVVIIVASTSRYQMYFGGIA
jgi:hypothetical protein